MASARPARTGFFPLDDELGLLPGMLTPRLQESLVRLSTWIPSFAKAMQELAHFTQVNVSRATAQRITVAAGAAAVAVQTAEVERILVQYPEPPVTPETLLVSADGAMVPLQGGEWAEVKTLAIGEVAPPVLEEGKPVVQGLLQDKGKNRTCHQNWGRSTQTSDKSRLLNKHSRH